MVGSAVDVVDVVMLVILTGLQSYIPVICERASWMIRDNEIVNLTVRNFLVPKCYFHVIHQMLDYKP